MEHEKHTEHEKHSEHEKHHETHTSAKHESKKRLPIWQISTAVLVLLLIVSVVTSGFGFEIKKQTNNGAVLMTGNAVADKSIKYINDNLLGGQGKASIDGVEESGNFYKLKIIVNGQKYESYATNDGKMLFIQGINLNEKPAQVPEQETQTPQNLQKSDKPKVELFVMSHCPYGTQMEKGILPVAKALDGKIDFEIKFVNYAMHGEKELQEQLRQYCIQKIFKSKYLQYLGAFLEAGDSQKAFSAIGLSDADISSCVKDADSTFKVTESFNDPQKTGWSGNFPPFRIHDVENKAYGVRGSPTLVINGAQANSGRDAKSLLAAICSSFNTKPSECNTDMSSYGTPGPGFGFNTQGGSAASAGCGA